MKRLAMPSRNSGHTSPDRGILTFRIMSMPHRVGRRSLWRPNLNFRGALFGALALGWGVLPAEVDRKGSATEEPFAVQLQFVADPNPPSETHRVLQPVHLYQSLLPPQGNTRQRIEQKMNPFLVY